MRCVYFGPSSDDRENGRAGHVGKGEIVFRGEREDIAFASDCLCSQ